MFFYHNNHNAYVRLEEFKLPRNILTLFLDSGSYGKSNGFWHWLLLKNGVNKIGGKITPSGDFKNTMEFVDQY